MAMPNDGSLRWYWLAVPAVPFALIPYLMYGLAFEVALAFFSGAIATKWVTFSALQYHKETYANTGGEQ